MDDKGLELSLGLPCGGSSSNPKDGANNSNPPDPRSDTDERTSKILNDFRNFLNPTIPPQPFQRTDQAKPPQENNLFSNFPQPATSGNGSGKLSGDNNKRKSPFGEMNNNNKPKKPETDNNTAHSSDNLQENNTGKASHISITTDEGSTADNEDVAESEADQGSTSRLAPHNEEGPHIGTEIQSKTNISARSFRAQSLNKLNIPYSISFKDTTPVGTPSSSSYHPVSSMMPGMGMHPMPPMTFGYSSVQIPVLNGDATTTQGGGIGHPQIQSLHSPYAPGRGISTSDQTRGQTKQPVAAEEGSSSQTEEDTKDRAPSNTFPSDYPAIKPGILADIKFGGSGTFPNLPWVSTTGPGPNGKTISGVTYKYNSTQIRIVCACHGTHMSPDEFIRHAASSENEPSTPRLASLSSTSPAASAAKS